MNKPEQAKTRVIQQDSSLITGALRTIPVYLKNGNKKIRVNVLLDDASTKTYLNADVAAELGLQGQVQKINVSVLNGQVETFEILPVNCVTKSLDGEVQFKVTAFTTGIVTGNMKVIDWNSFAEKWPHSRGIVLQVGTLFDY